MIFMGPPDNFFLWMLVIIGALDVLFIGIRSIAWAIRHLTGY